MICEHCGVNTHKDEVNDQTRFCIPCHNKHIYKILPWFSKEMKDIPTVEKQRILREIMEEHHALRRTMNRMSQDKRDEIIINYIKDNDAH